MNSEAGSIEDYMNELPEDRKAVIQKLRTTILDHLPEGFVEIIAYGMIGYVVPHTLYPAGYHCNPKEPLPFMNLASQKNFVAVYHMGIYANKELLDWFINEYPKHTSAKLDMGKSCIRFKNLELIPYELIGDLCEKINVKQWIKLCEGNL